MDEADDVWAGKCPTCSRMVEADESMDSIMCPWCESVVLRPPPKPGATFVPGRGPGLPENFVEQADARRKLLGLDEDEDGPEDVDGPDVLWEEHKDPDDKEYNGINALIDVGSILAILAVFMTGWVLLWAGLAVAQYAKTGREFNSAREECVEHRSTSEFCYRILDR